MLACDAPNTDLGVALRVSSYLDCQARALGENGFQALAGGPITTGLLSGLVTIFVALIGYRLILNQPVALRDTVGWAVRLGFTIALVTSWPAFQTLVYRVAVDGPVEIADVLLPATGLPSADAASRIQGAYDTLRLGPAPAASEPVDGEPSERQPPPSGQGASPAPPQTAPRAAGSALLAFPQTASAFVVATAGLSAALKIAIGLLLAVGPLAALSLLFDATLGLFEGWLRALVGSALGVLAATLVTALHLTVIEGELARLQRYAGGGVLEVVDGQALPTIVLLFGVVALAAVWATARTGGAIRLPRPPASQPAAGDGSNSRTSRLETSSAMQVAASSRAAGAARDRAAAVADALALTARREQGATQVALASAGAAVGRAPTTTTGEGAPGRFDPTSGTPIRRTAARRTRSAARRDRLS